jgi:hypothetical protein
VHPSWEGPCYSAQFLHPASKAGILDSQPNSLGQIVGQIEVIGA